MEFENRIGEWRLLRGISGCPRGFNNEAKDSRIRTMAG